jgi:hypothetical protein
VGATAVSCAFVFRVREINPIFTNTPHLIVERDGYESVALVKYKTIVEGFEKDKNILFNLDRTRIKNDIESADPLVRVTNIEAKFPNKLEIKVQERYPMYYVQIENGDGEIQTAILDYELQIICLETIFNREPYKNLINITDQFLNFVCEDFSVFDLGNKFSQYIKPDVQGRIDVLLQISRLLFSQNYTEADLRYVIVDISFTRSVFQSSVVIVFDPLEGAGTGQDFITLELRNYQNNFNEKLRIAWTILQEDTLYAIGKLTVYDDLSAAWSPKVGGVG